MEGMILITRSSFKVKVVKQLENGAVLKLPNDTYMIALYVSPRKKIEVENYIELEVLEKLRYEKVIIMGDFNLREDGPKEAEIKRLFSQYGINKTKLNSPTFLRGDAATSPDKVFTNTQVEIKLVRTITEHSMIVATLQEKVRKKINEQIYRYDTALFGPNRKPIQEKVYQVMNSIPVQDGVDDENDVIEKIIKKDFACTKKIKRGNNYDLPPVIRQLISRRNKIRKDKSRDLEQLEEIRKTIKKLVRNYKRENPQVMEDNKQKVFFKIKQLRPQENAVRNKTATELDAIAESFLVKGPEYDYKLIKEAIEVGEETIEIKDEEIKQEIKWLANGRATGVSDIKAKW